MLSCLLHGIYLQLLQSVLNVVNVIWENMPRGIKKENLPEKVCLVCGRPFTWRKKWADDWEHVKYCSQRCRKRRNQVKDSAQ